MTVGVIYLAHPGVELIVGDGGPEGGLIVRDSLRCGRVPVLRVHPLLLVVEGGAYPRGPVLSVAPGRVSGGRGPWAQGVRGHRGRGGDGRVRGEGGVAGARAGHAARHLAVWAAGTPRPGVIVGGVGAGVAVLVEGHVVRHVGLGNLLVGEQGVAGGELGVPWHENGRHHGGLNPLVVVGVDTDLHLLAGEGVVAHLQGLELVVGLEVGPAPHPAVDHVRQPLPVRHLAEKD